MQIYINTKNTSITVRNKSFLIQNKSTKREISPRRIDSISITANVQINTSAIKLAAKNDIPIWIYEPHGGLVAELRSSYYLKHSQLRHQQLLFMNSSKGIEWIKGILLEKTKLQIQSLKRWNKKNPLLEQKMKNHIAEMQNLSAKIKKTSANQAKVQATLMGLEGNIAKHYFKCVNMVLPSQYQFSKRSRRPGEDYFNVALNYIYGMTYAHVGRALQASGLDTFTGALHSTAYKEALVFDMIEVIRPIMDRLLVRMCQEMLFQDIHFKKIEGGYSLNRAGKKLLLPEYSDYLNERIKWNGKINTIQNHIYSQARVLKNTITLECS